ncbi:Acetyl esterase/lipase [Geosmithia morbida]|uniref:Acetyl esterase/lipase n=1 Tax=Geosmithia morbida TaxID=1094350 RepID=A0A9P5D7M4_9HYPO|nr:Acetyl esterase/lipase [Geosmithia morbida]KAF4124654.1 Acetyl esterase/lipase [Geosmithia morbida]
MEAVHDKIHENGTAFGPTDSEVNPPMRGRSPMWRELFEPLYRDAPGDITVVRDVTYGKAERNKLDVYFSKTSTREQKPVVVFVHAGGFYSGDKSWSEKCWANIGNYFAQNGQVAVLVNHQLVPHVRYPGGADDIQLVREWVYSNIASEGYGKGSVDKVILLGHSSGGAHVATNLYAAGDASRPAREPLSPPVAGVVYISAPFWFDRTKPLRQKAIGHYFGSDAEEVWGPLSPLGLFNRLPESSPCLDVRRLPTYVGTVKYEGKETADANVAFLNAYRQRSRPSGTLPLFHVADRHNHMT